VADLGAGVGDGGAGGQVAAGDAFGGIDHAIDGTEAASDAEPHDSCGNDQRSGAGREQDLPGFGDGGFDVGERDRGNQGASISQRDANGAVVGSVVAG
jgi:hypothetical protein